MSFSQIQSFSQIRTDCNPLDDDNDIYILNKKSE